MFELSFKCTMKLTLIFIIIMICNINTYAQQNLVPNGSFEQYDSCPNSNSQIERAKYWYNGSQGSSDYFNACASLISGASVPQNFIGYQPAHEGNAYAGMAIISDTSTNYREYLKVKLSEPLQIGQIYNISLYVSIAGTSPFCGISKIGFLFTNDSAIATSTIIYSSNAVYAYQNITDTVNWIKCSTSYQAVSNYKYLVIGDFSKYDSNSLLPLNDSATCNVSYVFIDGVTVEKEKEFIPNVFTPNNDGINDVFQIQGFINSSIKIYNRWGNLVFQSNNANKNFWNGTYKGKNVSQGVYYYVISNTNIHKTGFIQLLN